MEIFVINTSETDSMDEYSLKNFQKKDISNLNTLKIHCFAYYSIDKILKDVYNIKDREIIFIEKKPFLKSNEKFFSISHSGEYIVLSFSNYECGIDIEKIKIRDFKKIAKRMNFDCSTLEEFYNCWTKFEADFKLAKPSQKHQTFNFKEYMITASSTNPKEEFIITVQN